MKALLLYTNVGIRQFQIFSRNELIRISPLYCHRPVYYSSAQPKPKFFDTETEDEYTEEQKQRQGYFKGRQQRPEFSEEKTQQRGRWHGVTGYIRTLKWTPIPLSLGFALLAYQHWRRVVRRVENENIILAKDWEITCYRSIPLRSLSRAWGWVNNIELPVWCRQPFLSWYANTFHCDCSEAAITNFEEYRNLGEFFRRGLKDGIRPIDPDSPVVSPADGTILHFGKVENGYIEQVKGVTYSLPKFLGQPEWVDDSKPSKYILDEKYCSHIMSNPEKNCLYHCVIYLAPGDYHRFHSPAEWQVEYRRHFSGDLMSVNPTVARWIGDLFSLNERAVYYGKWKHGFFSMTAVGATNVGSIRVYTDEELHTNHRSTKKYSVMDKKFDTPLKFKKGDNFGEFNLGSTIVLIFEAPTDFMCSAGQRVKFGQGLYTTTVQNASHST